MARGLPEALAGTYVSQHAAPQHGFPTLILHARGVTHHFLSLKITSLLSFTKWEQIIFVSKLLFQLLPYFSTVSYIKMLATAILFTIANFVGSAFALATRDAPDINKSFNLYAYGGSVGGLSLFYADGMDQDHLFAHIIDYFHIGKAKIGDPNNSTSANAVPVSCKQTPNISDPSFVVRYKLIDFLLPVTRDSDTSSAPWVANPNTTAADTNATWSDEMLYIPSSASSSHEMGFTAKNMTNETTTGFVFYGQWVMVEDESGIFSSSFFIQRDSSDEGVYSLLWNVSNVDDAVPVSLRLAKPSNA